MQALPDDLRDGLLKTDEYLRTGCGPELKFTRKIEGRFPCCKLTYTAPHKLSYRVQISGSYLRTASAGSGRGRTAKAPTAQSNGCKPWPNPTPRRRTRCSIK